LTDGPLRRLDVSTRGRVQGVGFRYFVRLQATRLGLSGWVSNEPDGSVRVVAEGPAPALEALLRSISDGPSDARVDDVTVEWGDATGQLQGFSVRAGGHSGD
jgi:acylphosphatase